MRDHILKCIDSEFDNVHEILIELKNNPEVALEEINSSKVIKEYLVKKGFELEENCAGLPTAFKATKKNGVGPKIAVCIEYDALPEIGHCCGHHYITATSVLAGVSLSEILSTYTGEVTLFGTPAEETGEGKPPMVDAGYFDDYDIAMMLHPHSTTCADPTITSIGIYDITFKGKGAHSGAAPSDGINALDGIVQLYNSVSMMRQQLIDGTRLNAIILKGGSVINVIPETATIRYEIRTGTMSYYYEVEKRLRACAEASAMASGCELTYQLSMPICSPVEESKALADAWRSTLPELGLAETEERPTPFSTDMGNVSMRIPVIHAMGKMIEGDYALHTREFLEALDSDYSRSALKKFAASLAFTGLKVFEDKELLEKLRIERAAKQLNIKETN